jgi:hypothetical protein
MPAPSSTPYEVDFRFTSANEFWEELVISAYEKFRTEPDRAHAIVASFPTWHVNEWIWYERHPGEGAASNRNPKYTKFRCDLFRACPALPWIGDVADAGKHRSLGREDRRVDRVTTGRRILAGPYPFTFGTKAFGAFDTMSTPLAIRLADGNTHDFEQVLSRVIDYWRVNYFL